MSVPVCKLSDPYSLRRVVTHRLLVNVSEAGKVAFCDFDGQNPRPEDLTPQNPEIKAVFELAVPDPQDSDKAPEWLCGAVVVMPNGWHQHCRGEGVLALGNVQNFAYLDGVPRGFYRQDSRHRQVTVTFKRDANGAISIDVEVGEDAAPDLRTQQTYPVPPKTDLVKPTFDVAFIGYEETRTEGNGNETTLRANGATITVTNANGTQPFPPITFT